MDKSDNITIHEPKGGQGGTARGGHPGANLAPPLSSDQMDTFHIVEPAGHSASSAQPEHVVTSSGEKSWLGLNKKWVGISLVATGAMALMYFSRSHKRSEIQQEIPRGRPWNINLDRHESGMAV
ncbi:MAG: hypothetical protein ACJ763_15570 [Bdellovibrionia bacterium]